MDEKYIRYTFELMKAENELIEVRTISSRSNYSGYFKSVDNLIKELHKYQNGNIYFVLNKISDACYSREQRECFIEKAKNTTSDNDIINREFLLIDVDPKRSTGVSASNDEKEQSKQTINKIYSWLKDFGFCEPIICDSGNGFHLLYKISVPNNEETKELIKNILHVLDMYFSNSVCDIDKTVFNAARITKLYGTTSRKGNSTPERPHRDSYIVRAPETLKETPLILLQKVASLYPQPEKSTFNNNYGRDEFDLKSFISKHGINVTNEQTFAGGTKYILQTCLFNDGHKGKDAAIFQMSNGAIAYKCLHNSCSHYKWQDVRKMYEPNAYEQKNNNALINRVTKVQDIKPQQEITEKGKKFYSISEIENVDRSQIISMPSGLSQLDKKIIGFNKGECTLWSGKNGSAKSTILNQVALNSIDAGYNGAIFSGELQAHKLKNWLYLQAAGRQYTNESKMYEGVYYVSKDVSNKIDLWLKDKLFVYNNEYGTNFNQLLADFKEIIKSKNLSWVMFDNLMALELDDDGFNLNKQQKRFILEVSATCKKENIHAHIVAHPRKDVGLLRKESISGSGDLSNAVENVIICHRNNSDYQKAIADYFPKDKVFYLTQCSNYLEVCKNRDMGVMDYFVGLHYEVESKRLLNEAFENKVYGWQDINQQITIQPNVNFYEPKKEEDYPF